MSDKVATGTAYTSSVITVFAASWSFNELMMLGGFLVGLATFLYNCWYKERVLRDERKYKQALLEQIKRKEVVSIDSDTDILNNE